MSWMRVGDEIFGNRITTQSAIAFFSRKRYYWPLTNPNWPYVRRCARSESTSPAHVIGWCSQPRHCWSPFERGLHAEFKTWEIPHAVDLSCIATGGLVLHQRPDFLHEAQPIRIRKRCDANFLIVCFGLELFDVNHQDVVKSGEKQAVDQTMYQEPGQPSCNCIQMLQFHNRSMVSG